MRSAGSHCNLTSLLNYLWRSIEGGEAPSVECRLPVLPTAEAFGGEDSTLSYNCYYSISSFIWLTIAFKIEKLQYMYIGDCVNYVK